MKKNIPKLTPYEEKKLAIEYIKKYYREGIITKLQRDLALEKIGKSKKRKSL